MLKGALPARVSSMSITAHCQSNPILTPHGSLLHISSSHSPSQVYYCSWQSPSTARPCWFPIHMCLPIHICVCTYINLNPCLFTPPNPCTPTGGGGGDGGGQPRVCGPVYAQVAAPSWGAPSGCGLVFYFINKSSSWQVVLGHACT